MAHILLVEDDPRLARPLQRDLTLEQHTLDLARDGEEGWQFASQARYDLIILDVMLPRLDGMGLCRRLREHQMDMPVLMLTALDAVADRVRGLDAGADDYLVKPFSLCELHARLRALLRRSPGMASSQLNWRDLTLDLVAHRVTVGSAPLTLTPKEYKIMELLLRNPNMLFSPEELLTRVWGWEASPLRDTVKSHIRSLRQKLRAAGSADPIETLYGRGYRLARES
jgi:DNA-binding response OmpR family regulator